MMRFLRSTVANESCRMGRLQYRGFSSAAVADVTTTVGKKILGYGFKTAFLGVGYVFGGVTFYPVAKKLQEAEENIIEHDKFLDEHEAKLNARPGLN